MTLTPGTRIGPYEVTGALGAGGMGEVFRARDTRLGRDVAIKVLPAAFAQDPERLARFKREAQVLATLNHPNIAAIYGIEESAGVFALVLELVEGEDLAARLSRGPVPPREAAAIGRQIALGLEEAHEKGIVHRDLKPGNLKLTPDGSVKILDFGLAKIYDANPGRFPSEDAVSKASTLDSPLTDEGIVHGTPAYMSPEQARGLALDKRSDIWAFGCVVFEMLAGRRAFGGKTFSDTLVTILEREPDWTSLPASSPPGLRRLLRRCLEKDPRQRLRDIADARPDLVEAGNNSRGDEGTGPASAAERTKRPAAGRMLMNSAVLAAVAALAWQLGRNNPLPVPPSPQISIEPLTTDPGYEGEPTISPDGQTVAYVSDKTGNFEVVRRQIAGGAEVNLTNHDADDVQPEFSPDGQWIAFVSSRGRPDRLRFEGYDLPLMGGSIWVMPALGGEPKRVVENGNFPSWSPDGNSILYTRGPAFANQILAAPSNGGESREIKVTFAASPGPPRFLLYPRYSGDGRWIVFEGDSPAGFGPRDLYTVSATGGVAQVVGEGQQPIWSSDSGSVIYSNGARGANYSLWQVKVSPETGKPTGRPEPLTIGRGRDAHPTQSKDGTRLVFAGVEFSFNAEAMPFDADTGRKFGEAMPITRGMSVTYFQSFSPDGRSVAYESRLGTSSHLWKVARGASPVQLTSDPGFDDSFPRWSPKGGAIAFNRRVLGKPAGTTAIWTMAEDGAYARELVPRAGLFSWLRDGSGLAYFSRPDAQVYLLTLADMQSRRLTNDRGIVQVIATSADDKWLVYQAMINGNMDLRAIPIAGGEARTVVSTPRNDYHPFIAPSGRWLYFQPDHSNFFRVPGPAQGWRKAEPQQMTHFPDSGLLLDDPQWSVDGRQLLYSHGHIASDLWVMTTTAR